MWKAGELLTLHRCAGLEFTHSNQGNHPVMSKHELLKA